MRCLRETCGRAISPISLVLACGIGAAACERPSGTPEPTTSLLDLGGVDDLPSSPDLSVMHGWTQVSTQYFWGVWGTGPHDVWALGGSTYHYDGTRWSSVDAHGGMRAWGSGPSDVFTVGAASGYLGASSPIYHYDGASWSLVANPTSEMDAVWGSGPRDVWATGVSTILHFDGTSWTKDVYQPGFRVSGLWGSGPRDVWAFSGAAVGPGSGARYAHFDGTAWADAVISGPANARNDAMWGSAANDIWSVGDGLMHWNGATWTRDPKFSSGTRFYGVWGTGPSDFWAVREDSTVWHFDGTSWSDFGFPFSSTLRGIWGPAPIGSAPAPRELWVTGERGLYHYVP